MKNNIFKSRRFKYGTMATVITIIFLVVVIVVNIIATLLLDRFPISIDLTSNQAFELTDQSVEFVEGIDEDVTIYVLAEESYFASLGTYFVQTQEILKRYSQYNSHISVEYIDLNQNPDFVRNFEEDLSEGNVLVTSEKRNRRLTVGELYNIEQDYYTGYDTITSSRAEQALTSALMYVTDDDPSTVGVVTGHSETELADLESLLNSNNYETVSLRLLTETPGEEVDTLILAAPTSDYTDDEIKKLDDFLYNNGDFGKNIVYMASAAQPELPKLEAFLEEWGIIVEEGYIVETDSSNYYMSDRYIIQNYVDSTYTADLANPDMSILIPDSRPLTAAFEEADGNRTTTVLMSTSDTAVVRPPDAGENWDPSTAEHAAQNTAILGTRESVNTDNQAVESHVLVFGSADAFNSAFLSFSPINNGNFFVNVMNILNDKEEGIQIMSVALGGEQLGITEDKVQIISIIFYAVVPILVLGIGVIVWLRRRHL